MGRLQAVFAAFAAFAFTSCGSCTLPFADDGAEVSILSYNVHNLFDDLDDGTEYPEFDPSGGKWTQADYYAKLEKVAKVVRDSVSGGPDLVAFVEIENSKVLEDLNSRHLRELGYRFAATAPGADAPVRVGILSRLRVSGLRSHEPASAGFPQRNILEAELDADGVPLFVFVCHFKAKSEGAEATENSRRLAARLVRRRMAEILSRDGAAEIVVLGDLNENVDEFERVNRAYPTAILPEDAEPDVDSSSSLIVTGNRAAGGAPDLLYSPWLDDPPFPGSYWYRGGWESLDHVLLSRGLLDRNGLGLGSFDVVRPSYILDAEARPKAEYSDHLPILLKLSNGGKR